MTDYTICKQDPGQRIPRPWADVCSVEEAAEVIGHWRGHELGGREIAAKMATMWRAEPDQFIPDHHIDTEKPVFTSPTSGTKFFLFAR